MRIKAGKLANSFSLIDITYNKQLNKFQLDIVEYGEGGKGSRVSTTFYLNVDHMSLIADDVVNTRFRNNWENGKILYLMGGGQKARDLTIEVMKDANKILMSFTIRNGDSIKGKTGQTHFDQTKIISKSRSEHSLYDVRRMMKSIQDFIYTIDPKDRWKVERLSGL